MAKRTLPRIEEGQECSELGLLAQKAASMAGLGFWSWEAKSGAFQWSDHIYIIYGLDPRGGQPSLSHLDAMCHPEDRARLLAHRSEYGGADNRFECRIIRPDGEVRHVIVQSSVECGAGGSVVARYGTLSDVTDLKRAEAKARESDVFYRLLADHAPDMITRVMPDGAIRYVSPSCERVFGYLAEELMKLTPMDLCHPHDLPSVQETIKGMVRDRRRRLDVPMRYRARRKDGRWIWVESNPILLLDLEGEPLEFVDIVRDVTQTKDFEIALDQARQEAESASAAKASFLANMSHELRTPLTSIVGFAHLLHEREDLPEGAIHYAKRITDASSALLAVINDVLDFSKLDAAQVELESQPLSVLMLVEETADLIRVQAAAKGVAVHIRLDPSAPASIQGDATRLRQVMLNLMSNAVKFTAEGSVTIRTHWREEGVLKLAVVDTGPGIPRESRKHLFERFSQADSSIARTHGGTGLGLAISKGIVELMGGRIGLRSRVGRGSEFWFEIPALQAREEPAQANAEEFTLRCPLVRVLVVDDTAVNRELIRVMLTAVGAEIEEADGGSEGVKAAMTRPFDLILMDVRMPVIDGLEATRTIRRYSSLNARIPILALTADAQPENIAACRAAGMDDVLAKPIVPKVLLTKIMQWVKAGHGDVRSRADLVGVSQG
jgi:PAS domain S-box-containing protein